STAGLQYLRISNNAGNELYFTTEANSVITVITSRILFTIYQEKGRDQSTCVLYHV
ncbi:hypothetical protein Anapl_03962, partial [Anas platyrhynchos]